MPNTTANRACGILKNRVKLFCANGSVLETHFSKCQKHLWDLTALSAFFSFLSLTCTKYLTVDVQNLSKTWVRNQFNRQLIIIVRRYGSHFLTNCHFEVFFNQWVKHPIFLLNSKNNQDPQSLSHTRYVLPSGFLLCPLAGLMSFFILEHV
jgi:hypothetical protein